MMPSQVAALLRQAGLAIAPDKIGLERRGDRLLARLPSEQIAWFPMTAKAAGDLRTENRVLSLVGSRCTFAVPRVLFSSPDGWFVRSTVPGTVDPYALAGRLKADPPLRRRTAAYLGGALAQLHRRVDRQDVEGWLPTEPSWPLPRATIHERLPAVTDDVGLIARIDRMLAIYEEDVSESSDRVLVHSDLGLHNIAIDQQTDAVNGLFDFGDAAWADRHIDFRYFVFAAVPDALLDDIMGVYDEGTGITLSRSRVLLCNTVGAVSFLADREGHSPDEVVAGRTLEQDLAWTRWALHRASF